MENISCKLDTFEFSDRLLDVVVHFFVLHMKDSFLVWIGGIPAKLTNLSMAMNTKYVSTFCLCPFTYTDKEAMPASVFTLMMMIYKGVGINFLKGRRVLVLLCPLACKCSHSLNQINVIADAGQASMTASLYIGTI
jgi:hypothetical protein